MVNIPALFTNGRIVTGKNHGEAFSKLDATEQNTNVTSGFVDPKTLRFVSDEEEFFLKEVIMIRHAHTGDYFDPGISGLGHSQCERITNFIQRSFNYQEFQGFASCCNRTRETAEFIFRRLGIPYQIHSNFCDQRNWDLPCWRANKDWFETPYLFLERLAKVLESLPEKSIIVSHCNFIVNMAQLCMGNVDIMTCAQWKGKLPNCSMTYIRYNQPVFIGETDFENLSLS
jgi:broad specificity phosphatase PhoE